MTEGDAVPQLRSAVESLHAGVWMLDRDGVTVFANHRMTELLGVGIDEIMGRPLLDFVAAADRQDVLRHIRMRRDGVREAYDARVARPDGSFLYVRVQASPILHDGDYEGSVAALTDIDDLVAAAAQCQDALRQAEEAVLTKTRFLSWVSHELRTPLNAITGFAQLLQESVSETADRDMAGTILAATRHVNSLVQDLLDYSKADAGMLEPSLEPVSLRGVVDDALALVDATAREFDVRIDVDAGDERVLADRRHLVQVVLNLLSNAVKYGGRGTTVRVTTSTDGARVKCTIADEGPGIPPELQRQAFRPFERLANAGGVAGVGLGLSIAESFTRAMKGTLTLTSPPCGGATFVIDLPATELQPDAHEALAPRPVTADRLVLYVEDEPLNAALVESIVALLPGRELEVVPTVAEGIRAAHQLRPALVLLDLNLPDGSGLDVLRSVRADPATAATPVFVLSADATEQTTRRALDLGADRFVTKPFNVKEFLGLIDAVT